MTRSRFTIRACVAGALLCGTAPLVAADIIFPVSQIRTVSATANSQTDSDAAADFGLWSATARIDVGFTGFALANQESEILPDGITGQGDAGCHTIASGSAGSSMDISFEVHVPVDYTLTGTISAASFAATARVTVTGPGVDRVFQVNGTFLTIDASGRLEPGLYRFRASAGAGTSHPDASAQFTADLSLACPPGDLNGSGAVDLTDLALLLADFGSSGGGGDADGDGDVDLDDLTTLLSNFGTSCP